MGPPQTEDVVVQGVKKAIKRRRGDLIELDYFRVANIMISSEIVSEETHKRIKSDRRSDSGRMDELLDVVQSGPSGSMIQTFETFLRAIEKQNDKLASEIRQESGMGLASNEDRDEERIFVATDIFETEEGPDNHFTNGTRVTFETSSSFSDEEHLITTMRRPTGPSAQISSSDSSNRSDDLFTQETATQTQTTPLLSTTRLRDRKYNFMEVKSQLQTTIASEMNFAVDTAWIKNVETFYYYKGIDMVYKGCEFLYVSNKRCRKAVRSQISNYGTHTQYKCSSNHTMKSFMYVPHLNHITLEDSTGNLTLTLFSQDVEKFLRMNTSRIIKLNHDDVIKTIDGIRSCNYELILKCTRNKVLSGHATEEMHWDIVATITKVRPVAPHLRQSFNY